MPKFSVRKIATTTETIFHDGGPIAATPRLRAMTIAVVSNPFAGAYHEELQAAMEDLRELAGDMADMLIGALNGPEGIDSYGKGAIVGEDGEIEHAVLWHDPAGEAMRARLKGATAIVPACKKAGGVGTRLDIPLGNIHDAYVRSHFDGVEVGIPDGPKSQEILLAVAMARGPRIHNRMGGPTVA